jgi:hypothetical protein
VTGEEIGPESNPDLIGLVTGVVWNNEYATLTKTGGKETP